MTTSLRQTARAAGVLAVFSLLGTVLGFARETLLANHFGASFATDAYLIAAIIPTMIFSVAGVALGTTFIPVFAHHRKSLGEAAAFRLANTLVNVILFLGGVLTVAGEVAAPLLVRWLAPGFRGPVRHLTLELTRIMLPSMTFQGLVGVGGGMLQSFGVFAPAASAPVVWNFFIISFLFLFHKQFGVASVALGSLLGMIGQVIVLLPALRRIGYRYAPEVDLKDSGMRQIGHLVVPVLAGSIAGQVGLMVDRVLASGLREGSVSALNYASRLYLLPVQIFGMALSTATFPALSRLAAERDRPGIVRVLSDTLKLEVFILAPMAAGLIALQVPIVQLLFQRGAFDASATQATSWALLFFSLGIITTGVNDMLNRTFYSLQDTRTPLVLGISSAVVNIILNLLLVRPLAHGGLALGTSLASLYGSLVLLFFLRRRLQSLGGPGLAVSVGASIASATVMGLAVWRLQPVLSGLVPGMSLVAQTIRVASSIGLGGLIYAGLSYAVHADQRPLVGAVIRMTWNRIAGRR